MNEEIEFLIECWNDESIDELGQVKLADWLKQDVSNMEYFVEANLRFQMLRDAAMDELGSIEAETNPLSPKDKLTRPVLARITYVFAAMAACLTVAFFGYWALQPNPADNAAFATVVSTQGVGEAMSVDDRLGTQTIEIEKGMVRLQFDDGVEVTLEGPAEYELIALGKTQLLSGLLTAVVPLGAEGFVVETESAQIVDLGTAFGVEQRTDGTTQVSVFDGEVEVVCQKIRQTHLLREGQAIQFDVEGASSETDFEVARYEKIWPAASGISVSTGAFEFAPQWPRLLKKVESNEKIFVLPEGYPQLLTENLEVDMTGMVSEGADIPAGTRVRSFLLQFNPIDATEKTRGAGPRNFRRIAGSITFDRPVLGLIINSESLKRTDEIFAVRGANGLLGRGLESRPPRLADEVSLSDDRRTVTVSLGVVDRLSDHVRVIVDAQLNRF